MSRLAPRRTEGVSRDRWLVAQEAEAQFWLGASESDAQVRDVLAGQIAAASWLDNEVDQVPTGDWLEIGIGPLGMGCLAFSALSRRGKLVAVEPLDEVGSEHLSEPWRGIVSGARNQVEEWHQSPAERVEIKDDRFALIAINNVLDHVSDPLAVLREAQRMLLPDGWLYLSCDVRSWLGAARYRVWTARRHANETLVLAHPFQFTRRTLTELVGDAGLDCRPQPGSRIRSIGARTELVRIMCRNTDRVDANR